MLVSVQVDSSDSKKNFFFSTKRPCFETYFQSHEGEDELLNQATGARMSFQVCIAPSLSIRDGQKEVRHPQPNSLSTTVTEQFDLGPRPLITEKTLHKGAGLWMKSTNLQKLLLSVSIRTLSSSSFIGPVFFFFRIQIQMGNCTNIHDLCFDEVRARQT